MNTPKPKNPQFINAGCARTWNCPSCYRVFAEVKPGRALCQHCGQESELTQETQPVCVSTIINDGRS